MRGISQFYAGLNAIWDVTLLNFVTSPVEKVLDTPLGFVVSYMVHYCGDVCHVK